jgi:putative ABC transport system permease protein
MRLFQSFRVPLRFLRGQYGRTALTVMAVALGVALVCALDVVSRSMQVAFEEIIDTMAGRAALEVTAGQDGLVQEDVAEKVGRVPGVELAVPVVNTTAFLTDGSGEALTVFGVDFLNKNALGVYEALASRGPLVEDSTRFLEDPRAVVLTQTFAKRRGLHKGDSLELDTPRGKKRFSILRLFEPQGVGRVYGGNLVMMDLDAAEEAFTQPQLVSRIDVVVGRQEDVAAVRSAIAAALPSGLKVTTPGQRKLDLQRVMRSLDVLLQAVGLIGLVIAYLVAFNGISSGFERRAWQLGVLAAIGARPSTIWRVQMKEALILGIGSVALGVVFSIGLAHVFLPVLMTTTALNFNLVAPHARLMATPTSFGIAAALGIGVTLLAAWLPATRSVRLGIAATIRGKGRQPSRSARPPRWTLPLILWTAVALAVLLQRRMHSAELGLAATALIAAATAASAFALVPLAARALLALETLVGASGRLAATDLRESSRRAGLTAATIAVGVAAVGWLLILGRSFEYSVVDALGRAIRADLVVTSTHIGSGFLEAPLDAEALREVREVQGVQAAAGWRALEWRYDGRSIGLSAYDPLYFLDRRFGEWPLKAAAAGDVWEKVARGDGVVVSTSFVASFGKSVGDRLLLETPTGPLSLPILGVTVDFVSPQGTVEMSRDVFKDRWQDASVTRVFVLKDPSQSSMALRAAIGRLLGVRFHVRMLSAGELLDYFVGQVRRAFSVIPIFAATIYLVILIGLGGSLITSVLDRRRELAVVRAIGLRRRLVRRVITLESLAIAWVGLIMAAVGAALWAALWVRGTFQLLLGWALSVQIPVTELLVLALVTLGVCYVASLLPARRVGSLEVANILRYE